MVAAPAYILSQKISFLTTGMAEWCIQGLLFILGCLVIGRFYLPMVGSFLVASLCSMVLDLMLTLFAGVHAETLPGRLALYLAGLLSLALGIAFAFRSYLPCQMHEMFVKTVAAHKKWDQNKLKIIYDWICLAVSLTLTLCFFGKLVGIGLGTVLCTAINGPLIALWGKVLDRCFNFDPALKKRSARQ